jgi:hypothetical protein
MSVNRCTIACVSKGGNSDSTWLGNAAARLPYVTYTLLLRVAALQNRCLTPEIHCCCRQTTHSDTLTAASALNSLSAHRRKHHCLRRNVFLAPASLGAFLEDSPCPTGFRSKCNTTSARSVSLRRTTTHPLRYGSGMPFSRNRTRYTAHVHFVVHASVRDS